jgi:hypothetical protein
VIEQYLEDLESRIDPDVEDRLLGEWRQFIDGGFDGDLFSPTRARTAQPGIEWPYVKVNAALADPEAMLLQQFRTCSEELARGSGGPLCVRANYGTGIIPSLFGARPFIMDEDLDTLPTNWPLEGGEDAVKAVLEGGVPDVHRALGRKALETSRLLLETASRYPRISRYVFTYHPDLQGPLDICELLWGSQLFLDLYDDPDLVTSLLHLVTETYLTFMQEWQRIVPSCNEHSVHWSMVHRGRIMLRDDSAMNLSAEMFDTFVAPYDGRLLRELGGGAMHFCGKGDHYLPKATALPGVNAIHMTQPEYNDLEIVLRNTVDRGVCLIGLSADAARAALDSGRPLRGRVHSPG